MAFPTIPTTGAGRILSITGVGALTTHTFPNLSSLTKNSGDLLIAIVFLYDGNTANAEFSGWGGGFTEFGDFATTTTLSIGCAYKYSTGSETGTFTVTSSGSARSALILMSIAGAHASTVPEAGGYATGTNAAANPGTFNPTGWDVEDTLWIACAATGEDATTGSFTAITAAPTNYTDLFYQAAADDVVGSINAAVGFRGNAAASEDPGTFTNDTSSIRWAGLTIAVRPAAASVANALSLPLTAASPALTGSATAQAGVVARTAAVPAIGGGTAHTVAAVAVRTLPDTGVRMLDRDSYLRSTPHDALITPDQDIRVLVSLPDWSKPNTTSNGVPLVSHVDPTLVAGAPTNFWFAGVLGSGLQVGYDRYDAGGVHEDFWAKRTTALDALPSYTPVWLRVTGVNSVTASDPKFYYSLDGSSWTEITANIGFDPNVLTFPMGPIATGPGLGPDPQNNIENTSFFGMVFHALVWYDGPGGTLLTALDLRTATPGQTTFTDTSAHDWTTSGNARVFPRGPEVAGGATGNAGVVVATVTLPTPIGGTGGTTAVLAATAAMLGPTGAAGGTTTALARTVTVLVAPIGYADDPPNLSVIITGDDAALDWDASPTPGVATYDIFRRTPQTGDPFDPFVDTPIATGVATTSYADDNLAAGTYDWQVFGVIP